MTNHDQKKKRNKFKVDVELGTHTHIYSFLCCFINGLLKYE